MDNNEEEQINELIALESIYSDSSDVFRYERVTTDGINLVDAQSPSHSSYEPGILHKGSIAVYPELNGRKVVFKAIINQVEKTLEVSYITPLHLDFAMYDDYPSRSAPKFKLFAEWLTDAIRISLETAMKETWEAYCESPVLYCWIQVLEEKVPELATNGVIRLDGGLCSQRRSLSTEILSPSIGVGTDEGSRTSRQTSNNISSKQRRPTPVQLINVLSDYDSVAALREFNKQWHSCEVCFCDKVGEECVQFQPCGHVFCQECTSGFFYCHIREGSDPVTNVIQKMGLCPSCDFSFCTHCRKSYHGINHCKFAQKDANKLVVEYANADRAMKQKLEQRYGKLTLIRLVEESNSEQWIRDRAKPCPGCNANIEKSEGCNKVVCWRCHKYFCWLCLSIIPQGNPYSHFNNASSSCYNLLFEGVDIEENDNGDWGDEIIDDIILNHQDDDDQGVIFIRH